MNIKEKQAEIAYEIYQAREELGIEKSDYWDWHMAKTYMITNEYQEVSKWIKHFI